jgi:circadian clock protein KaiC
MPAKKEKFLKSHIEGFDKLLGEGIPAGSSVLVEGGPGSGKTLFCLNLLRNSCLQGKKCLYMTFEESEDRLRGHMEDFGWEPKKLEEKGLLKIKRFESLDIARSVEALLSEAKKELLIELHPILIPQDYKPDIVVVDSLSAIAAAFSGQQSRFRVYMEQFFKYLEENNITNFLIREVAHPSHLGSNFKERGEAVSFLADGIICIYNIVDNYGKRSSAIEVLKLRGANINRKIVAMRITSKGIVVYPEQTIVGSKDSNFSVT